MKRAYRMALCCMIFLSAWVGIGGAAEVPGIFFELADSPRLLQEVEMCRTEIPRLREKNNLLTHLNEKNEQLDEIRKEREALLRERIAFLEQNNRDLIRLNDQAIKTADLARKAGGGTWYEQLFTAGKWIGLGILVGVTLHAAK